MSKPIESPSLRGYAAPLDPRGVSTLYGPPPWHFRGRLATVYLRCDPAWIAAQVPAPLKPAAGPIARLSIYDMECDYGLGPDFVARRPEEAQFREGGVSLFVEHDGLPGLWSAFIWCDNDSEIAVGREMYGWPQRLGQFTLTRKPFRRDWRPGDVMVGRCSRYGRPVYDLEVDVERAGDVDLALPAFADFYTMTALPSPEAGGGVTRTIVRTRMEDVKLEDIWSGRGAATVHVPELAGLANAEPLGARLHDVSWTKPYGRIVHRETVPAGI